MSAYSGQLSPLFTFLPGAVSHQLLPMPRRAVPVTHVMPLLPPCPESVAQARQGRTVDWMPVAALRGFTLPGPDRWGALLCHPLLHMAACRSNSVLKESLSLTVGNLIFDILTNPTPQLFVSPSFPEEEVSTWWEEGCLLLSRGSLISWTWRSIELALLCC